MFVKANTFGPDEELTLRKFALALIGCGLVARRHAEWLSAEERAEMAVFFDPHADAARRLRDEFAPAAAVETELAAALRHPELDAAIICSPTLAHYEQVCQAFEQGLD